MVIKINYKSSDPIYKQIIVEIKKLIEVGELREGDSLPAIRKFASQLDTSVNTVARAYQELERLGLIETGGRKGTFVKGNQTSGSEGVKGFKVLIREMFKSGKTREQIRGTFESALNEIFD